ncbi:proline-rich protein HaeIII subfamily 1-like [Phyllostomus discolor]|uniref:Proline-rich protein HaeIII subfamily 1-like n=1 Tax=Phyllostomus discolor TaxID=89673 RepID=A0A7E6EA15_9CHIR|nr:proline-rich protein HaeIII subfamily 1-like [Phyllostomus discolor]
MGWGTESVEARSSRRGGGLGLPSCGFLGPPTQGWARGAPTRWLPIPLPLTHWLTKISLAGGSQPRAARPVTVPSCPGDWDSADPLARCPAGGGRRRRPAERRVPGDPGPRARRPEPPPSRPAFLVGLISPPGGARGRHPARLPRAPPPRSGAPRSPRLGVRRRCCVRPPSPGMQRVPGRGPETSGADPGVLGRATQVRPRARKPDPRASGLLRCAPRSSV